MLCQNPQGQDTKWACGRCKACRINRKRDWISRLLLESCASSYAIFLTLTYRLVQYNEQGQPTLDPEHIRNFIKRLRKKLPTDSLRYYAVGEYGTKRGRPHYHLLLFYNDDTPRGIASLARAITASWTIGSLHVGTVTPDSIAYTVGYIVKGQTKKGHYKYGQYPEFARFSKGLGKGATDSILDTSLDDFPDSYTLGGKIYPIPKYIRKIAKALGYDVNTPPKEKQFKKMLNLLPASKSFQEYDQKQHLLESHRKDILAEREIIEHRRKRSTKLMELGITERKKNETL